MFAAAGSVMSAAVRPVDAKVKQKPPRCLPVKFAFGTCQRCGRKLDGCEAHQRNDTGATTHVDCCMLCDARSGGAQ